VTQKSVKSVVLVLEHETIPVADITLEIVEMAVRTICPVQPLIHVRPESSGICSLETIERCSRIQLAVTFQKPDPSS
jgi:hypothetical protein